MDGPLSLEVRCTECGDANHHEVGALLFDPDAPTASAVYVPVSLRCPGCDAVDAYEVLPASVAAVAERADASADAEGPTTVQLGRAALAGGTAIRTPSEGLRLLRERAEARPTEALGWRRLGNFAIRADRHEEALDAFRRGAAIEGELECAIAVAAHEVARGTEGAFDALARAVARLAVADPARRPIQAAQLVEAARQLARGHLLLLGGAIDVSTVRDWSRLGELLASPRVDPVRLALTPSGDSLTVRDALARV